MTFAEQIAENVKCIKSLGYFCNEHCKVEDTLEGGNWKRFRLWPKQMEIAPIIDGDRLVVVLKARQLGLSWFGCAKLLKNALYKPNTQGLAFSYRDTEAKVLLQRIKGMHDNLPTWMQLDYEYNSHSIRFSNGSRIGAFPTTAGDSYSAATVLIDEAAIIPNLNKMLRSVKPTIDNGGQLILVSRANKDDPEGTFAQIYKAAVQGNNKWTPVFLPWNAHPNRTEQWYEEQKQDILSRTGALDDLYEQYPATDFEALQARELSKRIPFKWIEHCFIDTAIYLDQLPADVPGLRCWHLPKPGEKYVIAADVAEGKATSDDSAAVVLDKSGKQVAELVGRIEITVFSDYLNNLSKFYNRARVLVERNNHGHAIIERLKDYKCQMIRGRDGKYGHISDARGKAEMYSRGAEAFRDKEVSICSQQTFHQLASIERSTLCAPEGMKDDLADAYVIACIALDTLNRSIGGIGSF